jgi:hypothetical protein
MKTSRKAAHVLAGSIMTAVTIVGGAAVADAGPAVFESPDRSATESYYKIVLTDILIPSYSTGGSAAGYLKISTIAGESGESVGVQRYLKMDDVEGES